MCSEVVFLMGGMVRKGVLDVTVFRHQTDNLKKRKGSLQKIAWSSTGRHLWKTSRQAWEQQRLHLASEGMQAARP
jgi:hypothetical protein